MIKRGFSSAGQRRHRLPQQPRVPVFQDVEYLYAEAARQPGELIELPWTVNREPFILTAKLERRTNDKCHQWSFYRGEGANCKLEWTYESSDVVMIHSLVLSVFPQDAIPDGADPSQLMTLQLKAGEKPPAPQRQKKAKTPPKAMGVLEGSLSQMPLPSLLQSIANSHLTGRLTITQDGTSDLFFEEGEIVSAEGKGEFGEDAFIEVAMVPDAGDFKFTTTDQILENNITNRIDALLLKAATLSDHKRYLEQQELRPTSKLKRANPNLTEQEFEAKLAALVPVDMAVQKRLYQLIDNRILFSELLEKFKLNRAIWTPIMFNLVSSGLLAIDNGLDPESATATAAPQASDKHSQAYSPEAGANNLANLEIEQPASMDELGIDLVALEAFTKSMTHEDSGIYSEIAFLFFLEHEFYRFHSYDTPFSILLLALYNEAGGKLPHDTRVHTVELIKNTVRKADILGHYDGDDYGVILPHTDVKAAQGLIIRLRSLMNNSPFAQAVGLYVGVAGIPDDCQDLLTMLTIARQRKTNQRNLP